jgi:hypothetical protein
MLLSWRDRPSADEAQEVGPEERQLLQLLRQRLSVSLDEQVVRLAGHLRRPQVAAVLFYGSCLFEETRTGSSFPDFYVLTDDLLGYHGSWLHAGLNLVLPPNVYYASFPDGLRCKYCVMSSGQFRTETSPQAADIHHLGRFSKRFALAHARDEQAADLVVRGALRAALTLVPHSLALLPEAFTLEEFIITQLSLSYLGEQRVAEPDKVEKLFVAARDYYLEIYPRVLELHLRRRGFPRLSSAGRYLQERPDRSQRMRTDRFLRRSRQRGVLRWPKYMVTVDDWLQYILDKLERHQGIHLQLSPRERRHPILFGWPRFLEMRRRGVLS